MHGGGRVEGARPLLLHELYLLTVAKECHAGHGHDVASLCAFDNVDEVVDRTPALDEGLLHRLCLWVINEGITLSRSVAGCDGR